MRKNYSLLLSLLIVLTLLSSCSKDDTAAPVIPSEFIKAKTGSSYTFDEYSIDGTNSVIAGSQFASVSTILRTDGVKEGKTGVLFVEDVAKGVRDTSYYVYESNDNISVLGGSPSAEKPIWLTLPTGTGIQSIASGADSTTQLGITSIVDYTITSSLLGTEDMIVKGASLSVKKLKIEYHVVMTISGQLYLDATMENMLYYAPSLGFIAKTFSASRPDPSGGWIDGTVQTLVDYVLK
jgi:hypothetical protein